MKKFFFHAARYIPCVVILAFLCCSVAYPSRARGGRLGERVSFLTDDGVRISGLFYPPSRRGKKTLILLHGLASNQEEWQPFANTLVQAGYGFFSYDARGHSESTTTGDNRRITYETFGPAGKTSEWSKMVSDLGRAVDFIRREKKIAPSSIALAGASLGANVCLLYAATNDAIPLVILLSPGLNYAGLNADKHIANYRNRPLAIVASPGDTYAYQSSILLKQKAQQNSRAVLIPAAGGHGVQMLNAVMERKLLQWLAKH